MRLARKESFKLLRNKQLASHAPEESSQVLLARQSARFAQLDSLPLLKERSSAMHVLQDRRRIMLRLFARRAQVENSRRWVALARHALGGNIQLNSLLHAQLAVQAFTKKTLSRQHACNAMVQLTTPGDIVTLAPLGSASKQGRIRARHVLRESTQQVGKSLARHALQESTQMRRNKSLARHAVVRSLALEPVVQDARQDALHKPTKMRAMYAGLNTSHLVGLPLARNAHRDTTRIKRVWRHARHAPLEDMEPVRAVAGIVLLENTHLGGLPRGARAAPQDIAQTQ